MCKHIGKSYGQAARLALSYDFAFLSLMNFALNDCRGEVKKCRCIAHPLKKRPCFFCGGGYEYPAAAAQILIYHKLRDDVSDRGLLKKIAAGTALTFMKRGYNKAKAKYPELALQIEDQMKRQLEIEKNEDCSLDKAAEPSAQMMAAIAENICADAEKKRILRRFGYCIGRYVYICDAADDLRDDLKKGGFNPLAGELNINGEITEEAKPDIADFVSKSVNLTISELADCYVLLDIKKYKPILDNIIYLGLKACCKQIISQKLSDNLKNGE